MCSGMSVVSASCRHRTSARSAPPAWRAHRRRDACAGCTRSPSCRPQPRAAERGWGCRNSMRTRCSACGRAWSSPDRARRKPRRARAARPCRPGDLQLSRASRSNDASVIRRSVAATPHAAAGRWAARIGRAAETPRVASCRHSTRSRRGYPGAMRDETSRMPVEEAESWDPLEVLRRLTGDPAVGDRQWADAVL